MRTIANVDFSTATFYDWLDKTNQMLTAMSNEVVTANSTFGFTNGNAGVYGSFLSNTIIVSNTLRGGNTTMSWPLAISSNVNIANTITITGTTDTLILKTNNTFIVGNSATITGVTASLIDSFPKASAKSAKYFVTASSSVDTQSVELLLVYNSAGTLQMTKYGEMTTNTIMMTFDAAINGANVELKATPLVNNTYTISMNRNHQ